MTHDDAMAYAAELWKLHEQDVELRVTLAKFAASGGRLASRGEAM